MPHGHWKTTTFVGGLREDRLIAPMVTDGPMDGEMFLAYARGFLAPALRPGDIVILDNLSSHKLAGVRQAILAAGATLLYLPPYSPDLNPIEKLFSKLKDCSGKPPPGLSRPSGQRSAHSSTASHRTSVPTTSPLASMLELKSKLL